MDSSARGSPFLVHSGYMEKQGRIFKTWKRRYFTLYNNGRMVYKADANSDELLGELDVKFAAIESNGSSVSVKTEKRVLKLRCDSNLETQQWSGAMKRTSRQVSGELTEQGIFIELLWKINGDEKTRNKKDEEKFSHQESHLIAEASVKNPLCITFFVTNSTLRRWTLIFSSEKGVFDFFSQAPVSVALNHAIIARCNVGGRLGSQFTNNSMLLDMLGIGRKNLFYEPPSESAYVLHPLSQFLPSNGILVRRQYVSRATPPRRSYYAKKPKKVEGNVSPVADNLVIAVQIEIALAFVARADYPGVLMYHIFREENTLHVLELYANESALNIFQKDEQVERLKGKLQNFLDLIEEREALCWYGNKFAPKHRFQPKKNLYKIGNLTSSPENYGYLLHNTPCFPAGGSKSFGWAKKRRTKQTQWKDRFFVLSTSGSKVMRYFLQPGAEQSGRSERGSFHLDDLVIYLHGRKMFTMTCPKEPQPITIKARTLSEFYRWLQDLTPYAKSIYNMDTDKLVMGDKINSKRAVNLEIDVNIVSSIAAQLDQLNFEAGMGLNKGEHSHHRQYSSLSTVGCDDEGTGESLQGWFKAYTTELNNLMSLCANTEVTKTIGWFHRKFVKYFRQNFDEKTNVRKGSKVRGMMLDTVQSAKKARRKLSGKAQSTSFETWINQEYAPAAAGETFSDTCARHADSVRFFIECIYETLRENHKEEIDGFYERLKRLPSHVGRDEEDLEDLHIMTTVIAVERRVLTPIYHYVEFFVTNTEEAAEADMKIVDIRNELQNVCKTNGLQVEQVFDAIESPSGWSGAVAALNGLEMLRQPAEMLSSFMGVMHRICEIYNIEERERERSVSGKQMSDPDPIGADDYVPILLSVVARSNIKKPQTLFQMMSNVASAYILSGPTKYFLTMFESVLFYFRNRGPALVAECKMRGKPEVPGELNSIDSRRGSRISCLDEDAFILALSDQEKNLLIIKHLEERMSSIDVKIKSIQTLSRMNESSLQCLVGRGPGIIPSMADHHPLRIRQFSKERRKTLTLMRLQSDES
jgi:hypothetical protein